MKKLLLFLIFAAPLSFGQGQNFLGVNYVTSAPSGACLQGSAMQVVVSTGTAYTCQSLTWGAIGGGSLPTGLSFAGATLTISTAGSGNGVVALSGNTSGTCTYTVSATGVLVTASCPLQLPDGTKALPALRWTGIADGFYRGTAGAATAIFGTTATDQLGIGGGYLAQNSNGHLTWGSSATVIDAGGANADITLWRTAAGVLGIGTTTFNTLGRLKASGYMSVGTTFTSNAGCTDSSLTGGGSAGTFVSGASGTCTTIITMGDAATAPNGWVCDVTDRTTTAAVWRQTASAATTATLQATSGAVAADVIQFKCIGY